MSTLGSVIKKKNNMETSLAHIGYNRLELPVKV